MFNAHHHLDLSILAVICLSFVSSHELRVWSGNLKKCKSNKRLCVTDLRDCDPRPSASRQVPVNMSCYYQSYPENSLNGYMTCAWSYESNIHTGPVYSLLFSKKSVVISCKSIFNPASRLSVTLKIENNMEERETWSQPYTVLLSDIVKAPQPVLTLVNTTVDSVSVSWNSSSSSSRVSSCRLCYRASSSPTCTQIPGSIPVRRGETMVYVMKDLLPSTLYRATVACRGRTGLWSDWSAEANGTTLEKAPSSPPDTCYRVEKKGSGGPLHLHLMWKALEFHEAGGRILGYQVMYTPVKKQQQSVLCNSTELTALLVVEEGHGSVSVTAFNGAGQGPATQINIDTRVQHTLSPVRNLWVLRPGPSKRGLLVQWETDPLPHIPPPAPEPPVSHFDIQWTPETQPSTSHWTRVDGHSTSTVIQDHLNPGQTYTISVYPVHRQLCGPAWSLPASLEHGALLEAVKLIVANVTKTTATAEWVWQRRQTRPEPIRVDRYQVALRVDSERQVLSVWPDQWEHTFHNLRANTEYSLLLLADNTTRETVNFRTDFDEIETVAIATPLVLLALALVVICILTRTVYRSYFFPYIPSPRGSTTGQWMIEEHHQKSEEKSILSVEDFLVTDVMGDKSFIELGEDTRQPLTAEDKPGSTRTPSPNHPNVKFTAVQAEYIAGIPLESTVEHTEGVTHIVCDPDYVMNCPCPERASSIAEESREVSSLSLITCETENGANCHFPAMTDLEVDKQTAFAAVTCETSCVVNSLFPEMVTNSNKDQGAPLIHCETEYILSSHFPTKTTTEVLPCETGYVDNSHFPEGTTNKESTDNGLSLALCNPSCVDYESDYAVSCHFPEGTVPESPICTVDYVKQ